LAYRFSFFCANIPPRLLTIFVPYRLHSGPEKNTRRLMHHHFATVCCRITRFLPKCSGKKLTVYQAMLNLCQLAKYSLTDNRNKIHVVSDVTLHVNMTPLTIVDQLLIKTSQTGKGWMLKNYCRVSSETVETACSLIINNRV